MHMSRVIGENLEFLVFLWLRCANNSEAVIRASDIFAAALPTRTSNLRRLVSAVHGAPKFPGCGAEIWQILRFRPKVARPSELVCRARVPDVGLRCRGGLRNFRPPPTAGPASIPNTRSVEEYPSGTIIRFRALLFMTAA